ncbi:MAG: zinc ABC transporter substrate-binding protein [Acidilobaceae archaeon]|nr:zinc ABC transporter substrate-binding protein [Acidilobaceae archaeon]
MRKGFLAIATLLLILVLQGLVAGAHHGHPEHKVLIAVVPAHWAAVINMAGHPFVRAFSPLPPHIPHHDYEPSPEDIRRALQADIIVVENPDHVAAADDLIKAAQEAGKRYISVEDEVVKMGWRHLFKPSGVDNPHISHDVSATLMMLAIVRDEVAKVAREKGVPEAEVREFLIRYNGAMSALKAVYYASVEYGIQRAKGMKGVALFSAGDSQYMMKWILVDPVTIVVEESEAELRPGDLAKLKEAGVRCVVMLDEEKVSERVLSELRSLGIKPVIVRSLQAQQVGAPFLNYALMGELIASECAEEPAPAPEVGGLTIALGAYAAVVTLALAFLLLRRR